MRALLFDGSLTFQPDRPAPRPAPGEVLIRVHLAGICATDLQIVRGYMGFRGVPGHEFVGTVEHGPAELLGRRVVAEINCVCGRCELCQAGLSNHCRRRTVVGIVGRDGAFAELVAVPAANCHPLPPEIDDAAAVFVEPLAAAFQITRQVRIEPRTTVTILGSGRLGLLAAQVLARLGCRLQVVGRNPHSLARLDRLGITARQAADVPPRNEQDVVVDCTGSPDGLALALGYVRPRGTIVIKTTVAQPVALDLAPVVVHELTLIGSRCGPFSDAIAALAHRDIDVATLVSETCPLSAGAAAFAAAAQPDRFKILLDPRRP
ncbi:MAG: alcohol dehydrogenase catalytic domain-containing protein [Phycisphaerae bacterium]